MTTYTHTFLTGLQSSLVYRWNFLLRCCFAFIPLIGVYFFWGALFGETETVKGYDYADMLTYFVIMLVLDAMTTPTDDDFQIADDIRDGFINQVLLKPVHYGWYRLSLFFAGRVVYSLAAMAPLLVFLPFLAKWMVMPKAWETWMLTSLAFFGSALLQFLISFCTGLAAFWILDVGGIIFMLFGLEYMLGGHAFPLDLLATPLYQASLWLPFAYEYYFPVAVFRESLSPNELIRGFGFQWLWIGIMSLIASQLWKAGLKRYTAVGG